MGALGDAARDFVEVELHHVGVGVGQREGRSDAAGQADRAEQIGVVIALVGGLPWPRSAPGPLPNLAVLLTDAGPHPALDEGRPQTRFRPASPLAVLRDEPSARAGSFMEWPDPPSGAVRSPVVQEEEWVWILRSLGPWRRPWQERLQCRRTGYVRCDRYAA